VLLQGELDGCRLAGHLLAHGFAMETHTILMTGLEVVSSREVHLCTHWLQRTTATDYQSVSSTDEDLFKK